MHRLGLEYHTPHVIPRKLNVEKQKAFTESYGKLLKSLPDSEAVVFVGAVHPTHVARPAGRWASRQEKLAIEQTGGRQRINIHGAIDLETGQTRMIDVLTIDAASRSVPHPELVEGLESIEALYPLLPLIHEALLVATACSTPPEGRARWTLKLLAGAMVKLTGYDGQSRETVRRRLAENELKPWRKDMWCIPQIDGNYVARMEDVLGLYAGKPDPKRPVVCFDESPTQLIGEVRQPIPAAPGQLERYDCEYRRNGTVNLFVFLDAHRP